MTTFWNQPPKNGTIKGLTPLFQLSFPTKIPWLMVSKAARDPEELKGTCSYNHSPGKLGQECKTYILWADLAPEELESDHKQMALSRFRLLG